MSCPRPLTPDPPLIDFTPLHVGRRGSRGRFRIDRDVEGGPRLRGVGRDDTVAGRKEGPRVSNTELGAFPGPTGTEYPKGERVTGVPIEGRYPWDSDTRDPSVGPPPAVYWWGNGLSGLSLAGAEELVHTRRDHRGSRPLGSISPCDVRHRL